jgi:hypothetical protein
LTGTDPPFTLRVVVDLKEAYMAIREGRTGASACALVGAVSLVVWLLAPGSPAGGGAVKWRDGVDRVGGGSVHVAGIAFAWLLVVTYGDGSTQRSGYFTRDSCEEMRLLLSMRADVRSISECSGSP